MAEGEATGAAGGGEATPALLLNTHYVKDLSFENPNAPRVFAELPKAPSIDVTVEVDFSHLQDRLYEVVLKAEVKATVDELSVFLVELDFAGLATVGEMVSDADRDRLLVTEVPRHLFPFARAVISDVTRDGGFPPLLINPIDFEELFRNRMARDAALAQTAAT